MDIIYIQKRNNRYWVWMGSESDLNPKPAKCDVKFYGVVDATVYAENWCGNIKTVCTVRFLPNATL